ncbi:MAG: hypothetical protein K2W95_34355 [Candidatus Obscuribacterales bacterium]|nr:hypothetical protein [Candidatus Obscuribacterales bacterium]
MLETYDNDFEDNNSTDREDLSTTEFRLPVARKLKDQNKSDTKPDAQEIPALLPKLFLPNSIPNTVTEPDRAKAIIQVVLNQYLLPPVQPLRTVVEVLRNCGSSSLNPKAHQQLLQTPPHEKPREEQSPVPKDLEPTIRQRISSFG